MSSSKDKQQQNNKNNELLENNEELEVEFNLNAPDLKPKKTLTDYKQIGIDHLLQGSDSDDTDDNKQNNQLLLDPNMERIERSNSALIDHSQEPNPIQNDEDMQKFLARIKQQVNMKGDWLCHSCGIDVSGDLNECHMCNAVRPGPTDWICDSCTFVNAEKVTVCTMCLSERPNVSSLSASNVLSIKSEQTWSCGSCGYHNTKTQMCRMCGYVLGNEVTPQNDGKSDNEQEQQKDKINININAKENEYNAQNGALSPSKHISANSGKNAEDVFGSLDQNGWNLPDAPNHDVKKKKVENNGGGMMMMMKNEKKRINL